MALSEGYFFSTFCPRFTWAPSPARPSGSSRHSWAASVPREDGEFRERGGGADTCFLLCYYPQSPRHYSFQGPARQRPEQGSVIPLPGEPRPTPPPRACAPPGHKDRPLFPSGLRPEWAVQVQEEPVWLVLRRNGGGQAPVGPGSSPDRKPEQPATLFLGLLCRTHPSSGCSGEGVRPDAGEKQFWYPDRSFPESHSRLVGDGPGSYAWHSSS